MDAPLKANSGHQGTAMALAPLGHVLYSRVMKHDPADPSGPTATGSCCPTGTRRSCSTRCCTCHGYGLELDDIEAVPPVGVDGRPAIPEARHTAGVEVTTGPLGQGFANAVGMAIAERVLRARFGTEAIDHHTFVIAGDGCFMEGVSHEAASLAGHLGLGKLICVYDDNHITIDGRPSLAYSDDTAERFAAYGWDVVDLGEMANDLDGLDRGAPGGQGRRQTGRTLLILRSHIGYPSPDHTDDYEAHGLAFDADDVTRTKAVMGIPDEPFWAPPELVEAYRNHVGTVGAAAHAAWAARQRRRRRHARVAGGMERARALPDGPTTSRRSSSARRRSPPARRSRRRSTPRVGSLPGLVAGAADLTGNTGTKLAGQAQQTAEQPGGRQIHYGVREHAMGSAMVGMAMHGGILPVGGTFFVFPDYMRPPIRLAALSRAKAVLRLLPRLGRRRRGRPDPPTGRADRHDQGDPRAAGDPPGRRQRDRGGVEGHRRARRPDGAGPEPPEHRGRHRRLGRRARRRHRATNRTRPPTSCSLATGSEVALCVDAATRLAGHGVAARVVSLPSWDRFERRTNRFKRSMLPAGVPVLSVEAATTFGWARYADDSIGIERFGASAPGAEVLDQLGINVEHVVGRAIALVS